MNPSLLEFLMTGTVGGARVGMTQEEIVCLLGPPDAEGGTSNNNRKPCLSLYGSIELAFARVAPFPCELICWECERGPFGLRFAGDVDDSGSLRPGMTRGQVEAFLQAANLNFVPKSDFIEFLALSSGVAISFDDGLLWSAAITRL